MPEPHQEPHTASQSAHEAFRAAQAKADALWGQAEAQQAEADLAMAMWEQAVDDENREAGR